jgi:gamma-carbonic anhydrase
VSALDKQLDTFLKRTPRIRRGVFIARGAVVVGDVTLGEYASVWYNAVLRGDINRIEVGHHTNIQDNAVLHLADACPCRVGNYVTVGHSAVVHACTIGDDVLVGMGAIILDGAVIGPQCLIGAGALVPQRAHIPEGSLVLGSPARVVRQLIGPEKEALRQAALKYAANAKYHLQHRINVQRLPKLAAIPSRSSG